MAIRSVENLEVGGRRVLVRVDFNVPIENGKVVDDTRIRAALPTIRLLIERGARVVLASHLGRPEGKPNRKYSLEPAAARLADLLGPDAEVILADEPVGDGARKVVADLRAGTQVAMLENLRFDPGEVTNDDGFARALAALADCYVNDAFGAAHRAHASVVGVTRHLREKASGLLLERELRFLGKLLGTVERPYLAVLGGAKVAGKIGVIENLLQRVDALVVGGAMANTFLAARGVRLGRSRIESEKLGIAAGILARAAERKVDVLLPTDVVVARTIDDAAGEVVPIGRVPEDAMALDIGPATAAGFRDRILCAKTLFWNGPMGVYEKPAFARGTLEVARAVADADALSVVGGGDSVAALQAAGVAERISHVSTGGGASLEFLQGGDLPGLKALES
ncbi:MAG: phosphoglycerate kinase [Myxococcota bacterium]